MFYYLFFYFFRARRLFASGEVSVRTGPGSPNGAVISFEVSTGEWEREREKETGGGRGRVGQCEREGVYEGERGSV